jgi:hypothetical protein
VGRLSWPVSVSISNRFQRIFPFGKFPKLSTGYSVEDFRLPREPIRTVVFLFKKPSFQLCEHVVVPIQEGEHYHCHILDGLGQVRLALEHP